MTGTPGSRALDFLAAHGVMTLATHGEEGPWAAAVFYANEGFDLYFLSSPASRHCRNIASTPAAAATVQDNHTEWREIKGVQLEGEVVELSGDAAARARALYGEKFPIVRPSPSTPGPIADALEKVRWYKLAAARAYFIDNSAGFGKREQVL
jgi:uncharacterized protein